VPHLIVDVHSHPFSTTMSRPRTRASPSVWTCRPGRHRCTFMRWTATVTALTSALDLHGDRFHQMLAENPEWAGRRIEGPNISNVFKRTFYQIAFKFQVTRRDTSTGCALALPQPVWDSWQPFLGAPDLHEQPDGTFRLLDDHTARPTNWIYVFDIDTRPGPHGHPAPIRVSLVIGTDAATLSRAAFEVAPARAVRHDGEIDVVAETIARRLSRYLPITG
jgi:hypothetical protein